MAVGTSALVIVLSIFNGFEGLVKDLYSSFYPDIRITSATQKLITVDSTTRAFIAQQKNIAAFCFTVEENAHIQNGSFRTNAILKGVDDEYTRVSGVAQHISNGVY